MDDSPQRHRAMRSNSGDAYVDYAWTADQALQFLRKHRYDLIMLDHDLSEDPKPILIAPDGTYVASYMAKNFPEHRETFTVIHSMNPVGANRMENILIDAGYMHVHKIPSAWDKIQISKDGIIFKNK